MVICCCKDNLIRSDPIGFRLDSISISNPIITSSTRNPSHCFTASRFLSKIKMIVTLSPIFYSIVIPYRDSEREAQREATNADTSELYSVRCIFNSNIFTGLSRYDHFVYPNVTSTLLRCRLSFFTRFGGMLYETKVRKEFKKITIIIIMMGIIGSPFDTRDENYCSVRHTYYTYIAAVRILVSWLTIQITYHDHLPFIAIIACQLFKFRCIYIYYRFHEGAYWPGVDVCVRACVRMA